MAVLRLTISSTLVDCWTGRSVGFSPLENSAGVDALTVRIGKIASVALQATSRDEFAVWADRRHFMARCQRDELIGAAVEERIVANN